MAEHIAKSDGLEPLSLTGYWQLSGDDGHGAARGLGAPVAGSAAPRHGRTQGTSKQGTGICPHAASTSSCSSRSNCKE